MAIDASGIHAGMEVIGSDGELVGRVVRFDPKATPSGAAADPGMLFVEDPGVLGVGAGGLEIPLSRVLDVTPGHRLLIDSTRDQAIERFGSGRSLDLNDQVSA